MPSPGQAAVAWSLSRRVAVGDVQVRFREAGSGPVAVLVHGLGVSADYWWRNGPALAARGLRVLAPDLPGFGRTDGPPQGLSPEEQAAALDRWAGAVNLPPAVYVGHSLSCQTVIELAVRSPERVRGLVLASPTGAPDRNRLLRQLWGFVRDIPREPLGLIPIVGLAYQRTGPLRYWRTWHAGAAHDPFAVLPRVRVPGVVVVGTRDPVVDRPFAEALAAGLPEGRVVWIPGGAHAVLFDRSGAFNRAIASFVEEVMDPTFPQSPTPAAAAGSRDVP